MLFLYNVTWVDILSKYTASTVQPGLNWEDMLASIEAVQLARDELVNPSYIVEVP